ncbi:hypothetical protein DL89DRAFT_272719 [Linderina pennispora]|uniref:Cupredoxin n=1 Tax=Linderina pennispora TaxID=61395 RepID=A0A1Y1VSV2_9FUNG|nr:uncharacterized protein DL89DRAFT_272719 [Linderina pennispora]ORX64105.1 hypothetical protein DL89DRAFT_272719 [Linderina pennispora]
MRLSSCILLFAAAVQAKRVVHNWDITYLNTSRGLDQAPKRGITVNGKFPLPIVEAEVGDLLVLNVHNSLDVPTSLHAHGIYQHGTNYYDGVGMFTECSIAPGSNFTYEIPLKQSGTHWIHGHTAEQNFDGLRTTPHHPTGRPWTMQQSMDFLLKPNLAGLPLNPPPHGLINESMARLPSPSISRTSSFVIDDHDLILYEIDGVRTKPKTLKTIRVTPGQRASVLVKAKRSRSNNYSYHVTMNSPGTPVLAGALPFTFNGTVEYDPKAPPWLHHYVVLYDTFDYVEFRAPKVPTLFSALTMGDKAKNPLIYGPQTNARVLNYNEVIEIVLFSTSIAPHPFHLHGHTYGFSPLRRDTVFLGPFQYVVIRFRADNPGVWLFHCHMDWHSPNLRSVFVSAPDVMQRTLRVPQSVFDQCRIPGYSDQRKTWLVEMTNNIDGAPILPALLASPPH